MSESSPGHALTTTNLIASDRRIWHRYPSRKEIRWQLAAREDEPYGHAQACDISRGGLKLMLARKFDRGTMLRIRTVKEGPEKWSLAIAEIRYAIPTPEGKWMMGCAFQQELSEIELLNWLKD